jgi:hypothetical protein
MIYVKSIFAGLGTVLLAPIIFYAYIYFTHLRSYHGDGLVAVAGSRNEVLLAASVFSSSVLVSRSGTCADIIALYPRIARHLAGFSFSTAHTKLWVNQGHCPSRTCAHFRR